jgi:ABC-2 type transport system ATP-binding protein
MDDVKELCKRIIIIDHGVVYFDGQLQDVIDKYARNKILTVVLADSAKRGKLAEIGEIKEFDLPRVQILVPRKEAAKRAIKLFENFKIEDINIEEPPIEAINREVFGDQKVL